MFLPREPSAPLVLCIRAKGRLNTFNVHPYVGQSCTKLGCRAKEGHCSLLAYEYKLMLEIGHISYSGSDRHTIAAASPQSLHLLPSGTTYPNLEYNQDQLP